MEELSPEVACQRLREMRDEQVRDSSAIIDIGERLVRKYSHRFGDEMWLICEQVFLAALDVCRHDLAEICLIKLEKRFPNSKRVLKLQAIRHEANEEYEKALEIYDKIEKEDPTNAAIRKRKTSIYKAKGQIPEAIRSLTEYLKTFMADSDAWMELADLYIEELEYTKAAFCMEEVILMQPFNHLYHQRFAEIKYSQGGIENLMLARDHFAHCLFFSHNSNMRALYGLALSTSSLAALGKDDKKKNMKYSKWAAKMIALKHKTAQDLEEKDPRTEKTSNQDLLELTLGVTEILGQLNINST